MRLRLTVFVLLFIVISSFAVSAQVTSISQFTDVSPSDAYYDDLQSLIERYDVVGNDLVVIGVGSASKSSALIGSLYYPKLALTNSQFVMLLRTSIDRSKELAGSVTLPNGMDPASKYLLMKEIRSSINKKPLSPSTLKSADKVKGLSIRMEEGLALRGLIDEDGVGVDLLSPNGSYNRSRLYTEKEIVDILGNVFVVKPACVKKVCNLNGLTLDYSTKVVNRGRFAQLLNRFLDAYVERLNNLSSGK